MTAYYQAWKRADRNKDGPNGYKFIEKAFEAWRIAVIDSNVAANMLGAMHDGVDDFEYLPRPGGNHVRRTKREIEEMVWAHFRTDPDWHGA